MPLDEKSLRAKIVEYLNKNANVGKEGLGADDRDLIDSGVIDSFGLLDLIGFLETEFNIRIDASGIDPANFNTLAKIVGVVKAATAKD
jgi:acyl carrier protein